MTYSTLTGRPANADLIKLDDLCTTECQFAKDAGMPEYSCSGECRYERHTPAKPMSAGLTWSSANWKERIFLGALYAFGWGVVFPAMLIGALWLFGLMIEGGAHYSQQHDSCLKHATNGYEIKQCR